LFSASIRINSIEGNQLNVKQTKSFFFDIRSKTGKTISDETQMDYDATPLKTGTHPRKIS